MRISEALSLFTHLIALIGFFTIFITGQVDVLSIAICLSCLLLSFINERFGKQYYLSQGLVTALAFTLLLYVLGGVFFLGLDVFSAILTFLLYTQAIKLLGRKDMRDTVQIYILSFFQFLAGAILTVDFSYAVAFIVYVSVALWAIMVFTIRKETLEASSSDDPRVVTPLFISTSVIISFCIFIFTAMLFVSVPRIRTGFLMNDFLKPEFLRTGFSDEVKLGRVGEIKRDTSPVMRVRIMNQEPVNLPNPLYWRGIALDEFDGTVWRVGGTDYKIYKKDRDGVIRVNETSGKVLSQEIVTEPLDTDVLFAANAPIGFRGVEGDKVTEVNDSFALPGKVSYRLKYIAYSDVTTPEPDRLRNDGGEYSASIRKRYLQLPPLSERVKELATKLTRLDNNAYDKAVSIKRHLITNLNYTLTLEKGTAGFPLEDFLFENSEGHCEYFATAMVVLLRSAGIPARIVNGFIGGEWNGHGGFFLVRESNAHSWVEVFFPEHGWVIFDPTPPGDGGSLASGGFLSSYIDYLKYRWSRYVVDFSQRDQIRLFSGMQDKWRWQKSRVQNNIDFKLKENKKWTIAFLVLALVAWSLVTRPSVASIFSYHRKKPDEKATAVYKKALNLLSKKAFNKADSITPREYAREVIESGGKKFQTLHEFTEKYIELRFRGEDVNHEIKELEKLLDVLRREIR